MLHNSFIFLFVFCIETHCESLCLKSVCVCNAAVMALATCQILHSSFSIVRSGHRLLLISHSFYSKALEHIQLEAQVDQDVEYAKSALDIMWYRQNGKKKSILNSLSYNSVTGTLWRWVISPMIGYWSGLLGMTGTWGCQACRVLSFGF